VGLGVEVDVTPTEIIELIEWAAEVAEAAYVASDHELPIDIPPEPGTGRPTDGDAVSRLQDLARMLRERDATDYLRGVARGR
jgi:hypothetical protein